MKENSSLSPRDAPQSELLPCPFCGGPARVSQKYRDPKPLNWRVFCDNEDPIKGELCAMAVYSDFETREEAIAAWNRRPASMAREEALPNKGRATEVTIVQPRTGTVIRREIWEMITHEGRRYLCVPDRFVQPADQTLQIEGRSLKSEGTPPKEEGVDLGCDDAEFGMSEHRTPPKDRGEE